MNGLDWLCLLLEMFALVLYDYTPLPSARRGKESTDRRIGKSGPAEPSPQYQDGQSQNLTFGRATVGKEKNVVVPALPGKAGIIADRAFRNGEPL